MIGSSSVPNRAWLRRGEYVIPKSRMTATKETLDTLNEGGVESSEVPDEVADGEEVV